MYGRDRVLVVRASVRIDASNRANPRVFCASNDPPAVR